VERVLHGCALLKVVDGRVALVKEGVKKLTLPGGKQERGETIEECIRREIREETGQEIMDCEHWFDCVSDAAVCHVFRSDAFKVSGCRMIAIDDCDDQVESHVLRALEQYKCMMGYVRDCSDEMIGSRTYRRYRALMKRLMKYGLRDGKMVWGVHGADINALMDEIQKVLVMYSWLTHYVSLWGSPGSHFRVDVTRQTWSFYLIRDDYRMELASRVSPIMDSFQVSVQEKTFGVKKPLGDIVRAVPAFSEWNLSGYVTPDGDIVNDKDSSTIGVVMRLRKRVVICVLQAMSDVAFMRALGVVAKQDSRVGHVVMQVVAELPM